MTPNNFNPELLTAFTRISLSASDAILSQSLTHLNLCWLQNERALYAQQKLNMKLDPKNVEAFMQEEAELHGKLNLLTYLIDCANEAVKSHVIQTQQD